MAAERLAKRFAQRTLIRAGFLVTLPGIVRLLVLVRASSSALAFVPSLIVIGAGAMLAPSINVVQSSFPDEKKCEISGLPRAISNLGLSLGTAIAGTILVSGLASGNRSYAYAILALAADGLVGVVPAVFMRAPGSAESASWRAVQLVRAPRVLIDGDALDAVGDVFEASRQAEAAHDSGQARVRLSVIAGCLASPAPRGRLPQPRRRRPQ